MAATAHITALHTTARRTTARHTTAPRMRGLLLDWVACTRIVMVAATATDTRRRSIGATAAAGRVAVLLAATRTKPIFRVND
jgi:hypothetical protein